MDLHAYGEMKLMMFVWRCEDQKVWEIAVSIRLPWLGLQRVPTQGRRRVVWKFNKRIEGYLVIKADKVVIMRLEAGAI